MFNKLLLSVVLLSFSSIVYSSDFIHPMSFSNTEAEKERVVEYIETRTDYEYCGLTSDMCYEKTLRMIERENLNAFKRLISVTNKKVLNNIIEDYCSDEVNMCNYVTIEMMYHKNLRSSKEKLTW